jgi:PST family polysaccharide transporter
MKDLLKSTVKIGSTEIALIIVGVLKNKYLAVTVGPEGYGLFSILDSFFGFFLIFAGGWLSTPVMRYVSDYRSRDKQNEVRQILNFAFSITLFTSLFFISVFFIFSDFIINTFIDRDVSFQYYALFAASFLGTSLNSIMQAYFQGMLMVNETIYRKIVLRLFDVISAVVLVLLFGLTGFFINVLVIAFFGLFIFLYKSNENRPKIAWPDFKNELYKKVMHFGSLNLFIGIFNLISIHLQRIIVVRFLDMLSLGLYRAASTFTNYLALVGTSMQFMFNAKASEAISVDERNKRLNDYIKVIVLSSILLFVPGILFSDTVIHTLYSKKFLQLGPILYVFIIAQYLLNIQLGIQANIVGLERFKIYTIVTLIAYSLVITIPYFFLKKYGIKILGYTLIITSIEETFVLSLYLYLKEKVYFNKYSLLIIFIGLVLMLGSVFFVNTRIYYRLFFYILSLVVFYFLITKRDKEQILVFVNTKLKKK